MGKMYLTTVASSSATPGSDALSHSISQSFLYYYFMVPSESARQARSQGWARTGIDRTGVISARPSVNRPILRQLGESGVIVSLYKEIKIWKGNNKNKILKNKEKIIKK